MRAAELSNSFIGAIGMREDSKTDKSTDKNTDTKNLNLNLNATEKVAASAQPLPTASSGNAKFAESPNSGVENTSKKGEQNNSDPCQLLTSDPPTASTLYPTKAGNYVYLTSSDDFEACVQDALGKKTAVRLNKDQGMSVYGKSPWQIVSPSLQKIQIYFQGARVNTALISGQTLQLVEQSLN